MKSIGKFLSSGSIIRAALIFLVAFAVPPLVSFFIMGQNSTQFISSASPFLLIFLAIPACWLLSKVLYPWLVDEDFDLS